MTFKLDLLSCIYYTHFSSDLKGNFFLWASKSTMALELCLMRLALVPGHELFSRARRSLLPEPLSPVAVKMGQQ